MAELPAIRGRVVAKLAKEPLRVRVTIEFGGQVFVAEGLPTEVEIRNHWSSYGEVMGGSDEPELLDKTFTLRLRAVQMGEGQRLPPVASEVVELKD